MLSRRCSRIAISHLRSLAHPSQYTAKSFLLCLVAAVCFVTRQLLLSWGKVADRCFLILGVDCRLIKVECVTFGELEVQKQQHQVVLFILFLFLSPAPGLDSDLLWSVHPNLDASSTFDFIGLFDLITKLAVNQAGLSTQATLKMCWCKTAAN